jgi:L-2-hydroxyglutarate oxidase
MEKVFDIAVIGGGIVGAATAYKLQNRYPDLSICLFEKEKNLAPHQTGNNSGVIHSGIYYKPGSYKATTCVDGRRELVQFAKEHKVAHDICGKIIVATEERELAQIDKIYSNGMQNGVEDIRKINAAEIKEIEPQCSGIAGLYVGCTGIIDFKGATEKMAEAFTGKNEKSALILEHEYLGNTADGELYLIKTNKGNYKAKYMIFCGGLQSDRLAKSDGVKSNVRIVGFRGDYYELTEQAKHKVKNLIYPVPDPRFPFLGVHFTRMTNGEIECGPNAVFTFKREGYGKTDFDLKDSVDALSFIGTWKLFAKHWQYGLDEYRRAFSKKLFLNRLRKLIPSLEMEDIKPGRAGVRAMALGPDGNMIDDFKIEYRNNSIHVLNAPSPAATAALSIGKQIGDMAQQHFGL